MNDPLYYSLHCPNDIVDSFCIHHLLVNVKITNHDIFYCTPLYKSNFNGSLTIILIILGGKNFINLTLHREKNQILYKFYLQN